MANDRISNKIALVTGAARGQGRSHVIRLAAGGADVIAIDICRQIESADYSLATEEDLAETMRLAEKSGTRVVPRIADVRDPATLGSAIDSAVAELGGLDVVSVNAGISGPLLPVADTPDEGWADVIAVNLTGAINTARAVLSHLRRRGKASSSFTSSVAGVQGVANLGPYVASKHGVVGRMRTMAVELGPENIRVNAVLPTSVPTPMLLNEPMYRLLRPDLESPGADDMVDVPYTLELLPVPYVETDDVTSAVLWLASDEAGMITGVALPVDGGALLKRYAADDSDSTSQHEPESSSSDLSAYPTTFLGDSEGWASGAVNADVMHLSPRTAELCEGSATTPLAVKASQYRTSWRLLLQRPEDRSMAAREQDRRSPRDRVLHVVVSRRRTAGSDALRRVLTGVCVTGARRVADPSGRPRSRRRGERRASSAAMWSWGPDARAELVP